MLTYSCILLQLESMQVPQQDDYNYDYDRFTYYDILSNALTNSSFNLHKLSEVFGKTLLCVPVTYNLHCMEECDGNYSETVNCTSSYTSSFLWTYFDPSNYAGRFLFSLTRSALNYFLLGVSNETCPVSKNNSWAFTLYLQVQKLPCLKSNVSIEELIVDVLKRITGRVSYCSSSLISIITLCRNCRDACNYLSFCLSVCLSTL